MKVKEDPEVLKKKLLAVTEGQLNESEILLITDYEKLRAALINQRNLTKTVRDKQRLTNYLNELDITVALLIDKVTAIKVGKRLTGELNAKF